MQLKCADIFLSLVVSHKICDRLMFLGDLRLWEKRVYVCGLKKFHVCGRFYVSGWFYVCGEKRFTFVGTFYVYGRFTFEGVISAFLIWAIRAVSCSSALCSVLSIASLCRPFSQISHPASVFVPNHPEVSVLKRKSSAKNNLTLGPLQRLSLSRPRECSLVLPKPFQ